MASLKVVSRFVEETVIAFIIQEQVMTFTFAKQHKQSWRVSQKVVQRCEYAKTFY